MLRFIGLLTEPNEVGNLMLATIGAGFGYWPIASRRKKTLTAVVMIGAAVQGVMADSRSPFVGIAIGCALYLVWKYRFRGAIAVAALFAIFYTAAFAIPSMRDYLNRGDVASFTGRQVAWDFAVHSVKESPILGYGFEVEGQILHSQYFPGWDEVWNLGYQSSLHDGFVSRAVSLGIPALLFWLFFTLRPMVELLFSRARSVEIEIDRVAGVPADPYPEFHGISRRLPLIRRPHDGAGVVDARARETLRASKPPHAQASRGSIDNPDRPSSAGRACLVTPSIKCRDSARRRVGHSR